MLNTTPASCLQVFVVGGNGGNAGAAALQQELEKCGVECSVVGVPKSIDNDILLIDKVGLMDFVGGGRGRSGGVALSSPGRSARP